MFERFTDRARRVVVFAQTEAMGLDHHHIGTEHLLLGLLNEPEGVAGRALENLGIELEVVRTRVEEMIGRGQSHPTGHIPFTPRAKKVLELALREALGLGHNYIGTEHILLGLVREAEGVAAQVLETMGAGLDRVRGQVVKLLKGGVPAAMEVAPEVRTRVTSAADPEEEEHPGEKGPRCPNCRAWLGDTGEAASRMIVVGDAEGGEPRAVVFLYCGRCGVTVAAWPEASSDPD